MEDVENLGLQVMWDFGKVGGLEEFRRRQRQPFSDAIRCLAEVVSRAAADQAENV